MTIKTCARSSVDAVIEQDAVRAPLRPCEQEARRVRPARALANPSGRLVPRARSRRRAGNGLNFPHHPPSVTAVVAVEAEDAPSSESLRRSRERRSLNVAKRRERSVRTAGGERGSLVNGASHAALLAHASCRGASYRCDCAERTRLAEVAAAGTACEWAVRVQPRVEDVSRARVCLSRWRRCRRAGQ